MIKRLLLIIFVIPFSIYLLTAIITGIYVYKDNPIKSDAIIVLGSKAYYGDDFNPCLQARVNHAVELYEKNLASKIIMSGGDDAPGGPNEALAMQQMAEELDVKRDDILLEQKSTSTYENLKFSKPIMERHNLSTAIIVTEKFHNYRADMVASEVNLPHTLSPTSSPCWDKWKFLSKYFLREPIALIYYKLTGML
jgi:uncharacterized SAM-binding protein YcdF (DUF218 family)